MAMMNDDELAFFFLSRSLFFLARSVPFNFMAAVCVCHKRKNSWKSVRANISERATNVENDAKSMNLGSGAEEGGNSVLGTNQH